MKIFLVRKWEVKQGIAKRKIGYFSWSGSSSHPDGWGLMFWFFGISFYTNRKEWNSRNN